MWGVVLVCACALFSCGEAQSEPSRVVNTAQGPVRGYKVSDGDVYAFFNIPYATAPTGLNRFKAPEPPANRTGIFNAVDRGVRCPQSGRINESVNCLIANIFIPDTSTPQSKLPVMVVVHGGAFQVGHGLMARPVTMVNTKKLIVVNFNYRVGVLGFLCMGTEDIPGNAGMKDQVALLRWVQANIAEFGGDPEKVTIAGCSAGGASVDLLRVSRITSGLFVKAIPASGGNAGAFGIQVDPIANAKLYAGYLDFENVEDLAALEDFYKTTSLQTLFSRSNLVNNRHDSNVLFVPCVERDIGVERFLDDAPVNLIKEGPHTNFPMLYGFAEMEGIMRQRQFNTWRPLMNQNFSNFLPGDLQFSSDAEKEEVAERVRKFYFGDEPITESSILQYIDYFTDVLFGYSMLRSVRLTHETHGSNIPIYLYEYSFVDENTNIIIHTNNTRGATHCDQFRAPFDEDESRLTPEFRNMKAVMRKLFIDFVTTGNPVGEGSTLPVWRATNANRDPHMNFHVDSTIRGAFNQERAELWDSIYEKHYRYPVPPSPIPIPPPSPPSSRVVNTEQGPVRGYKVPDGDVYAFFNIPYATAPTGLNRFKAPEPPANRTGTFEAIDRDIRCPSATRIVPESVNCLVANIFVPDTSTPQSKLPVMVHVHGGAFQFGFGNSARPVTMVNTKKLIVVNFNYRIGVLGFLCMGTDAIPGNAGMKDQVALLRWVQANIAEFGGDPDQVTIAGCSAGGASVDLLRVSRITSGLFVKAIPASGGNAGAFGIQVDPIANAKLYAGILDFENIDDLAALEDFYKTTPLQRLFNRTDQVNNRHDSNVLFVPCVERDIGVERFLDDAPINLIREGTHANFPMLYGFAEMEGIMRQTQFNTWRHLMNEKFSNFLPGDLQFSSDAEKEEVAERVRKFYFGDEPITESSILQYIDYFTDVLFGYSMLRSVRLTNTHGTNIPIYLYEYSFVDENTNIIIHTNNTRGATHCDQFRAPFDEDESRLTPEYRNMKAVMRKLFIDFVTTGNPVGEGSTLPVWRAANANRDPHMNFHVNSTIIGAFNQERAELWDSIYDKHYRYPVPPSSANIVISSIWIVSTLVIMQIYQIIN